MIHITTIDIKSESTIMRLHARKKGGISKGNAKYHHQNNGTIMIINGI